MKALGEAAAGGARLKTEFVPRWVWGRPVGWGRGEGSGRLEGRQRGVHPLFPAIRWARQEGEIGDRGKGAGRVEGRQRGGHPLFPATREAEQEGLW